jgi:hypothetical protein
MSVNMIKQSAKAGNLTLKADVDALLLELGVEPVRYYGGTLVAKTPITSETVAYVREVTAADATMAIERAHAAFLEWRLIPSPKRGELVRLLGEELRTNKRPRSTRFYRGRQDRVRRSRRSPGDDRHLRLRRGSFPAALRLDDSHGAQRAPYGRRPGIRSVSPASSRRSTSRSRSGHGMPRWHWSAATAASGSLRKRLLSLLWRRKRCLAAP